MMARALALNGAHKVYIVGRRKEILEKAAKSVSTDNIIPLVGDVTSKEALSSIVSTITSETGYINVLIANSGTLGPQAAQKLTAESTVADFQKAYSETSFEEFADTFKLNTVAVWYTIVAFLGLLDEGNKKGNVEQKSQVIATSSIGAFNRNTPGGYAYGQSKAATTHMMKQLATGLAPFGIRSNVLAPGREFVSLDLVSNSFRSVCLSRSGLQILASSMSSVWLGIQGYLDLSLTLVSFLIRSGVSDSSKVFPSELAAGIIGNGVFPKSQIPLERVGTEEDMAGCILFLTSRAGAYCTGNVVILDGGRLSMVPATY